MSNRATAHMIGRVVAAPEMKYSESGKGIANFSLAVNNRYKDKDEVSFFRFTAFGATAEMVSKHLSKGRLVSIESEPRQSRWEKDGSNRESVWFMVTHVTFLDSPSKESNSQQGAASSDLPSGHASDEYVPF